MVKDLDGPLVRPAAGGKPHEVVVLLHGYGSDGEDLIGLVPYLRDALPTAYFIAPNGPDPCEMGGPGHQWFSLVDRSPAAIAAGVAASADLLDRFLDRTLAETGVAPERLALVGFSQGTMMTLHVGPRRQARPAALIGFSGRLAGAGDLRDVLVKPPVLLIHGSADDVVPAEAMGEAVSALGSAGFDVDSCLRPGLGHSMDEVGILRAIQFLQLHFYGDIKK